MEPIDQFKQRYQEYVGKQATAYVAPKKSFFNKFYVQGLIVGVAIVISGVLVYINFQPGKPSTPAPSTVAKAPTPTQKPAITVTEAQIDQELMKTWQQYYSQIKDNPKYRESAKNALIKRTAVLAGVSQYNLDLSSIASDNPAEKEIQTEDQLAKKVLSWRSIDYVYVFVDSTNPKYQSYPEKVSYSYNLIKKNLDEGKTMQESYDLAKKDSGFFKPITITTDKLFYKDGWDKNISDLLFKYKKGNNTDIISPPGGVYLLAHINDANDTAYATMDEWIKSQGQP